MKRSLVIVGSFVASLVSFAALTACSGGDTPPSTQSDVGEGDAAVTPATAAKDGGSSTTSPTDAAAKDGGHHVDAAAGTFLGACAQDGECPAGDICHLHTNDAGVTHGTCTHACSDPGESPSPDCDAPATGCSKAGFCR